MAAVGLAVLVGLVFTYWQLANSERVCRLAESYLSELIGGEVNVQDATFNVFSPVELRGVRVHLPGSISGEPFFSAEKVLLNHRPWLLFTKGRLWPTEISCFQPQVVIEQDSLTGRNNLERFYKHRSEKFALDPAQLAGGPKVYVHNGVLRFIVVDDKRKGVLEDFSVDLNLSMVPEGDESYVITFEGPRKDEQMPVAQGVVKVNVVTGKIDHLSGKIPEMARLDMFMPRRYSFLRRKYNMTGAFYIKAVQDPDPQKKLFEIKLEDVSLSLPSDEGGMTLQHVQGLMRLDADGVNFVGLTGGIENVQGAKVTLNGRLDGYDPNSPFLFKFDLTGMEISAIDNISGTLAEVFEKNRKRLDLCQGPLDLTVNIQRSVDQKINLSGSVKPQGMTLAFSDFPYELRNVRGKINFTRTSLDIVGITASHGMAKIKLTGKFENSSEAGPVYEFQVQADDLAFDSDFMNALPVDYRKYISTVNPTGSCTWRTRVSVNAPGAEPRVETDIIVTGKAGLTYVDFPYPLTNVRGVLSITPEKIVLSDIGGVRIVDGKVVAKLTVNGVIDNPGADDLDVNVTVKGQLPLDKLLADALGDEGTELFKVLKPAGRAEDVVAVITEAAVGPMKYDVTARLVDVSFVFGGLDYRISGATGELHVRPQRISIKNLVGTHDDTTITINGDVLPGEAGDDLALNINIKGADLPVDLFKTSSPQLRRLGQLITASGDADLQLSIKHKPLGEGGDDDYDYLCILDAKDMRITPRGFNYPIKGIQGRVIATPGRVKFENLRAVDGRMQALLNGEILSDGKFDRARLEIKIDQMPIDDRLLAALSWYGNGLLSRFRPGGTCSVDIQSLRFERPTDLPAQATSKPATSKSAATQPTSDQRLQESWNIEGTLKLDSAAIDLGLGLRNLTGEIVGSIAETPAGLAIDADIHLPSVQEGKREITDLRGRLTKQPQSSLMRINRLQAKAYGGKLAGHAEILLGQPLRFGIDLSVNEIDLNAMFNAGITDPNERTDFPGKMSGNVKLTVEAGDQPDIRAAGELHITDAQIGKLPVMMGLLHVFYLTLPGETAFKEAIIKYSASERKLTFTEIYLRGRALSMVGAGEMDMNTTKLAMYFLSRPGGSLPRMANLAGELLEGISRELVEIRVTGTLAEPKTETVALRSLRQVLHELLSAGKEDD